MECEDKMLDSYEQYKHCRMLLDEENNKYDRKMGNDLFKRQCMVNIIEVRNLPGNIRQPFVQLFLETPNADKTRYDSQDLGSTEP